jgi:AmmeMemoRadiSam system protein A
MGASAHEPLDDARGQRLVTLARDTIVHELGGPRPERPSGAWAEEPGATFVTVTRLGRLHGCIGSLAPRRPLAVDVERNAVSAAFMDPRSEAFRAEWLPEMGLEVTLLGPLAPIAFTSQEDLLRRIEPRVDGLVLSWRGRRGTFLPQVWESLPEPRDFLDELKMKAGLPPDFWAGDVAMERFRVQKWGDRRIAPER